MVKRGSFFSTFDEIIQALFEAFRSSRIYSLCCFFSFPEHVGFWIFFGGRRGFYKLGG